VTPDSGHPAFASVDITVDRSMLGNPFEDNEPACDVPVYTIDGWRREHGDVMPDHPCMFAAEKKTAFQVRPNLVRGLQACDTF
jgi:hypothetical protein